MLPSFRGSIYPTIPGIDLDLKTLGQSRYHGQTPASAPLLHVLRAIRCMAQQGDAPEPDSSRQCLAWSFSGPVISALDSFSFQYMCYFKSRLARTMQSLASNNFRSPADFSGPFRRIASISFANTANGFEIICNLGGKCSYAKYRRMGDDSDMGSLSWD